MAEHFHARFLQGPTYDPDIPSLVFETDGTVIGFIGTSVVPMLLDGRVIRSVSPGPLITTQSARAVSAFLIKSLLAGQQEFTYSDRQTVAFQKLFVRVGARPMHPRCVWWEVRLRPLSNRLQRVRRTPLRTAAAGALAVPAMLVDSLLKPLRPTPRTERPQRNEPLSADTVIGALSEFTATYRLRPHYDEAFWRWRMLELAAAKRLGRPRAQAVYEGDLLLGWFVYMAASRGASRVLQLCARPGNEAAVLHELVADADRHGVVALRGRLEPEFDLALREMRVSLTHGNCLLVHARNTAVFEAFASERALVTQLDGEAWISATFAGAEA